VKPSPPDDNQQLLGQSLANLKAILQKIECREEGCCTGQGLSLQVSPQRMTKICIVGNGMACASFLDQFRRQFVEHIEFTLIDSQKVWIYPCGLPRALVDAEYSNSTLFPLENYLKKGENGRIINAKVTGLEPNLVICEDGTLVDFDYLVIASGTTTRSIFNLQETGRVNQLEEYQTMIKKAHTIVMVGGGPSACELAAEILSKYSMKKLTIIHSQETLLSNSIPLTTKQRLERKLKALGVHFIMNDRVELGSEPYIEGNHTVRTAKGVEIKSDLTLFCVSRPRPNSQFLEAFDSSLVDENGFIIVKPTLQLGPKRFSHIFSLGDVAKTGAPKMALVLEEQARIVAKNITLMITSRGSSLVKYKAPEDKSMVISLGRWDAITAYSIPLLDPIIHLFLPLGLSFFVDFAGAIIKGPGDYPL
jgi:NADH dehydrogenase FAD-containing subunit